MATELTYMYRDGSNYKQWRSVCFEGDITPEQEARLRGNLVGPNDQFLPEQVGLESLYEAWGSHYDDDHPWHELCEIRVVDIRPNTTTPIDQFVATFETAVWDEETANADVASWKESTPRGR